MCYAIPGKVEAIDGRIVTVDYFGQKKKAVNELSALNVGDYVFAQGGYVIQKLAVQEAEDILSTWKEMFFTLQELDQEHSRANELNLNVHPALQIIAEKIKQGAPLADEEYISLLELESAAEQQILFQTANTLRQKYHQNACCVHGIIEISNHCRRNCTYCGISTHNQSLPRYRMSRDEILEAVREAVDVHGFKALVLQSGEDCGYTIEELEEIIREIKQKHAVLILISFGEIGENGLERLFQAGARGLLMRFETSNPELYAKLHPGYNLESRLKHIRAAFNMGYLIITGGIIGIPGQKPQDIINDIRLAKALKPEMLSFGPFLPHPETPLGQSSAPEETKVLKALALARCMAAPDMKILVTTAYETLSAQARQKGLMAGASSLMINVTPLKFRPFYAIYPHRAHEAESLETQVNDLVSLLKNLGRGPADLGMGQI